MKKTGWDLFKDRKGRLSDGLKGEAEQEMLRLVNVLERLVSYPIETLEKILDAIGFEDLTWFTVTTKWNDNSVKSEIRLLGDCTNSVNATTQDIPDYVKELHRTSVEKEYELRSEIFKALLTAAKVASAV